MLKEGRKERKRSVEGRKEGRKKEMLKERR